MSSNTNVIIVAGGSGTRINNPQPKQFIEINNKPIIIHTIEKFFKSEKNISIYIAVHPDYHKYLSDLIQKFFPENNIHIALGGETRFHSVKNALQEIKTNEGIVCIHDAARPMVSVETIKRCIETTVAKGNATPFVPVNESLRELNHEKNIAVNRNDFVIIQTPQCFRINEIKSAFEQTYESAFTDDASVFEKAGHEINLVMGNIENIKITYPIDLLLAQQYLK